jgi:hypothetical protein
MLGRINDFIVDCSYSLSKTLTLVITFGLTLWQLQDVTAKFPAVSGGNVPFDMQNLLRPAQIYEQLPLYTDQAFNLYTWFQIVDYFFPLLGGLMMGALCAFAIRVLSERFWSLAKEKNLFLLFLVPTVFDWLENIGLLWVLAAWPEQSSAAANFAVAAKMCKLGTLFVTQPLALILLIAGLGKWFYQKARGS